ncbi:MAG: hypothetical protein ACI4JI_08580 [Ruminiclostridium sp.]
MKKAIAIICLAAAAIMIAGCSGKAITLPNVNTSSVSGTTDSLESSAPETSEVNSSQAETTTTSTTVPETTTTKAPETTTTKAPETKPAATTTTVKEPKPEATTIGATTTKKQDTPTPAKYITFSDGTYTFKLDASIWKKTEDPEYDVDATYEEDGITILALNMMKSPKADLGEDYAELSLKEIGEELADEYDEIGLTVTSSAMEKINGCDAYHIVFSLVYDQHIYLFESGKSIYLMTIGCAADPNGNAQDLIADAISGFSLN